MAKITPATFKKALENATGTRVDMSKRLKVTRGAVTIYLSKNPDMAKLLDQRRLDNIERAEDEIFSQLEFKDSKNKSSGAKIRQGASQFILKTLGRSKGWVEKQEQLVEHKGESLKVIIEERKPEVDNGDKSST